MTAQLGFGFLRLPMKDGQPDYGAVCGLVDAYLARGGRFFDTAYTYLNGKSEEAIRECLVKGYPRDAFQLCSKLPGYNARSYEESAALAEESFRRCGVDFFDIFMLHWLNAENYAIAGQHRQFDLLKKLKAEGRARKIGFSFHDAPEVLDRILTEHPEVDCVLLQINYLDWDSPAIQSRRCWETARRHGKEILVMEPVKGGTLAEVPAPVRELLDEIDPGLSPAAHAIRFARSLPGVITVLSGMNSLSQIKENLEKPTPVTDKDRELLRRAAAILSDTSAVACTGCGYCLKHCPQAIPIPDCFRLYNAYCRNPEDDWKITPVYNALASGTAGASDCIGCGQCAQNCPQKLPIPELLKKVSQVME